MPRATTAGFVVVHRTGGLMRAWGSRLAFGNAGTLFRTRKAAAAAVDSSVAFYTQYDLVDRESYTIMRVLA